MRHHLAVFEFSAGTSPVVRCEYRGRGGGTDLTLDSCDNGLTAGATGNSLVLRSPLGYTGTQPRIQMLQNREFVDARVEIYGKHGSRSWVKMAEYQVDRQLLTE